MNNFHFLRPFWLITLLPLILLLIMRWRTRVDLQVWRNLVDPHLLPYLIVGQAETTRHNFFWLLGLGWLLLVLALAGPVWRRLPQPVFITNTPRVILLDLSPSMNATDVKPSRLARARFEILDLLHAATDGQTALIAFGPEPFIVAPLTSDAKTIAAQVPQLTTELLPAPGSRHTDLALWQAAALLKQARLSSGTIILITDAIENLARTLEAARSLADKSIKISILAIGTDQTTPIPNAQGGLLTDSRGALQLTQFDPQPLRELAHVGNGIFITATIDDQDTRALLDTAITGSNPAIQTNRTANQWQEEGSWLLLPLLPIAAFAFRRGWLLALILCTLLFLPQPSQAFDWSTLWQRSDQQAVQALAAGDPKTAATKFQDPEWRAAANYRAGEYEQALQALNGLHGPELDYNRGNALAHLGKLKEAEAAYEQTLKQNPNHTDAKYNLDLIKKLIDQQQKSESSDKSNGDQPNTDPSDQDQQQSSNNQQNNNSSSDPSNQDNTKAEQSNNSAQQQNSQTSSNTNQNQSKSSPSPSPTDLKNTSSKNNPDPKENLNTQEREQRQSIITQLSRVPDDPAGLLRQRFLLQHLRRNGQMP